MKEQRQTQGNPEDIYLPQEIQQLIISYTGNQDLYHFRIYKKTPLLAITLYYYQRTYRPGKLITIPDDAIYINLAFPKYPTPVDYLVAQLRGTKVLYTARLGLHLTYGQMPKYIVSQFESPHYYSLNDAEVNKIVSLNQFSYFAYIFWILRQETMEMRLHLSIFHLIGGLRKIKTIHTSVTRSLNLITTAFLNEDRSWRILPYVLIDGQKLGIFIANHSEEHKYESFVVFNSDYKSRDCPDIKRVLQEVSNIFNYVFKMSSLIDILERFIEQVTKSVEVIQHVCEEPENVTQLKELGVNITTFENALTYSTSLRDHLLNSQDV